MFLILLAFLMKFVDVTKLKAGDAEGVSNNVAATMSNNNWQHVARRNKVADHSNSSSTSSGCDSNTSSSKENCDTTTEQHHTITPQQLQQIRHYQRLQQQQLQLLQQQLLQRRRLQQQLRAEGVVSGERHNKRSAAATTNLLTCNQQYLQQQRLQQQQHLLPPNDNHNKNNNQQLKHNLNNNHKNNNNNINENNNNNLSQNNIDSIVRHGFAKGQQFRRGMTEFSTNNDISNKSHHSQPLQNSPHYHYHQREYQQQDQQQHHNSPQHHPHQPLHHQLASINNHLTFKQNHNHKFNQQTLPLNSSANINHCSATTSPTSATHSPLHYKNPLNSPNNSPFAYAYYGGAHYQQHLPATTAQQQQQQHLRLLHNKLSQTNYQQHLNDLLLQQQHLQQQQQHLLTAAAATKDENGISVGGGDELSDECLKQNVAIVLNNLDRYNNALRSIILNEQVTNSLFDDSLLDFSSISSNNNFLLSNNSNSNSKMATAATPESDYNSNATTPGSRVGCNMLPAQQQHDNVWFLDYGYRDGCSMQRSVLSSLSASYNGIGELLYYEDMAKNIDANLAEVDMESFRAEDIHSLLSQLPSYCKGLGGGANSKLQQSLMQQHMLPAHNMMSQTSTSSTNELIDNSICKSELLFSPVKESHISVDSLDLDAYPDDGDIILTCKANKDNYTIAFEGSVLYSDESFYEPSEISLKNKQNFINLHSNLDDIVKRKSLEVSMSRSEHQLTTWTKLKKGNASQLQRYPSGNNNTAENAPSAFLHAPHITVRKSSSLPNLRPKKESPTTCSNRQKLNVSHVSTSTIDSCRSRNLLPMCQMPISCSSTTISTSERLTANSQQHQQQQQQLKLQHNHLQKRHHHHQHPQKMTEQLQHVHDSCSSASSATLQKQQNTGNTSSGASGTSANQPAFNLVKLFIKQKSSSCSSEEHASAHTCMDVSSGCWPSSDAAGSSSSSSLEQRLRKKSMNDSGKGSALSRHDEEELMRVVGEVDDSFQLEEEEEQTVHNSTPRKQSRRNHEVFHDELEATGGLPRAVRRRSLPLRHPQVCHLALQHQHNNNNGSSSTGSMNSAASDASRSNSEQLTQVYMPIDRSLERKKARRREVLSSRGSTASSEMITRSMQTSCGGGSISTRSSLSDRFRFVPPSFLAKLNNLGEEKQAPIYVIYPNYALPDLGFVQTHTTDVFFSTFNYKAATAPTVGGSGPQQRNRYTDDEILKNIDYKHVVDWKSLATLLPSEYRKRLAHIPEVANLQLQEGSDGMSQKPLFCMTPPIRRQQSGAHICDCAQYFQQTQAPAQTPQHQHEGSSSSGSSQQPSSGYRGSSTLLTDSDMDTAAAGGTPSDPLKQMYVYQYEQQRMDSGVDMLAASPASKFQPTPQPRGILRKAASQGVGGGGRNKRNSMIEGQQAKMSKLEKRRSLQETAYNQYLTGGSSAEELYSVLPEEEVFEEHLEAYYAGMLQLQRQSPNQRLSRKDMDARARAENFLSSLPRSELKYYAEIASILESSEDQQNAAAVQYDAAALKKEVSRALSQQKKVSFNEEDNRQQQAQQQQFLHADARTQKRFSTPPNSPNISVAGGLRMPPPSSHTVPRRSTPAELQSVNKRDSKEALKISSNRFKRLQIQWELLSKDSSMMLKDLACEQETKSGGSTPTSAQAAAAAAAHRSRIPRPVSYPAGKRTEILTTPDKVKSVAKIVKPVVVVSPQIARITNQDASKTGTRSPSRIVPPKRYSMTSPSAATMATSPITAVTPTSAGTMRARTPTSRANATAPNTPRRRVQSPRTIPRVR